MTIFILLLAPLMYAEVSIRCLRLHLGAVVPADFSGEIVGEIVGEIDGDCPIVAEVVLGDGQPVLYYRPQTKKRLSPRHYQRRVASNRAGPRTNLLSWSEADRALGYPPPPMRLGEGLSWCDHKPPVAILPPCHESIPPWNLE